VCLWTLSKKKLLQLLDLNHSCLKYCNLAKERKVVFLTQATDLIKNVTSDLHLAKVHKAFTVV